MQYAQDMSKICQRYAQNMPKICPKYAKDMPNICLSYVWDMPMIYPSHAQDLTPMMETQNSRGNTALATLIGSLWQWQMFKTIESKPVSC